MTKQEYETILKVLTEKIRDLELTIYCKNLEIENLKKKLEGANNEK